MEGRREGSEAEKNEEEDWGEGREKNLPFLPFPLPRPPPHFPPPFNAATQAILLPTVFIPPRFPRCLPTCFHCSLTYYLLTVPCPFPSSDVLVWSNERVIEWVKRSHTPHPPTHTHTHPSHLYTDYSLTVPCSYPHQTCWCGVTSV